MSGIVDIGDSKSGLIGFGNRSVTFGANSSQTTHDYAADSWQLLLMDTALWNIGGGVFDGSSARSWTAPVKGKYSFIYGGETEGTIDDTQFCNIAIRLNGSSYPGGGICRWYATGNNHQLRARGTVTLDLSAGNYVQFQIYQNGPEACKFGDTFFGGFLV